MTAPNPAPRRAFTLIEMLVAIAVVAVVAAVVVPMFNDDSRVRLMAASSVLISDIEMAQVMTISFPEEPVVVRFDTAKGEYWLAYASDPETPLDRADTGDPYLVQIGAGRAVGAQGVAMELTGMDGQMLEFTPHGGLSDFTVTPYIELSREGGAITLMVTPTTGTVREFTGDAEAAALLADGGSGKLE